MTNAANEWQDAETAVIDDTKIYLVWTNGGEWRDPDMFVRSGKVIKLFLKKDIVRGRPTKIAEINLEKQMQGMWRGI